MIVRRRRALGGQAFRLSYGSRRHAAYAHTCRTSMDCTASWLKGDGEGLPPIVAEGRVPNRGVAFQLFERRATTGRQPGNDSSFQIVSSLMQNAPPGIVRRRGVALAPLAGSEKHSRSAPSRSGRCADFLSRTLVFRVRGHAVFPRIPAGRRARADDGAPGCGERSGGLVAGDCEHQSERVCWCAGGWCPVSDTG